MQYLDLEGDRGERLRGPKDAGVGDGKYVARLMNCDPSSHHLTVSCSRDQLQLSRPAVMTNITREMKEICSILLKFGLRNDDNVRMNKKN